jgi:iron complex transport system ATP-binding protein
MRHVMEERKGHSEGPRGRGAEGPRVALADVHASFGLFGVDLSASPHELVVILGANGAGKSTLLRVITGLVPTVSGTVKLFGEDVTGLDRAEIARRVAVVPQDADVAYGFRVREVVAMGRAPHQSGWMQASAADDALVERSLEEHDLASLGDRSARDLSGGEKKRVAIARAFCQDAPVLLLDEPTASLDVKHQLALFDLLDRRTKAGLTCVVVLHDLNLATLYCDRVLLLKAGRLVGAGPPAEVITYGTVKAVYETEVYVDTNDITGAVTVLPLSRKYRLALQSAGPPRG